ncbi:MAG: amino acid ABC transporter substrate-binding protein [Candidatus Taylorbacteria bacterium]|nr:amino acid ABC transporter substrate-binding protein [Candidatus Taylorbacteria bacterium]
MKKTFFTVIVIAIVILIVSTLGKTANKKDGDFTVGAVLPLTGPAALWGETVKNGMELALEGKTGIKVLYEDSKSTAVDGISAYNLLQNKRVDLVVSETSTVAVPLSKLALERKLPLLVSLVAAEHSKIVNDYTTRYYTDPANYAMPAFIDSISPINNVKKIALLYRNDELGVSVKDKIVELSATNKKEIVIQESFTPNEKDYRTILTKIKNSGARTLIFVVANPLEAVGIVKTANELNIGMPMIESSAVFADLNTRKQVGGIPFYSSSYDFSLPEKAKDFKEKYVAKFGKEPNFGAAFGYDILNLIDICKNKKEAVRECLSGVNKIDGVAGTANQVSPGDFVVTMHLEKVN